MLIYALILVAAIAFNSGIFLILGLGWTLIAFAATLIVFVIFLSRGLVNNEE
jgi:hypothetical protein